VGSRVAASAPHLIPAGELVRVVKVDVKRSRVDLQLHLEEPLLISWTEGPFELFDQARCRIELELEVPREWIKKKSEDEIRELLATVLELHPDRDLLERSESWNRRRVEALPEGYEDSRAEYEQWRVTRLRGELLSALDKTLRSAQRVVDRADDDPSYGAGMAAGMEKEANRYRSWDDCDELVKESFYPAGKDAPAGYDGADEKEWEKGYRDGQTLAFNVELGRRIGACLEEI
jgi:hypothetical protein